MALKYLINKTHSHVSVIDSRFLIPKGGWLDVEPEVAEHEDTIDAKRKGWLEISDVAPDFVQEGEKIEITPAGDELKGSLTPPGVPEKTVEELATPIQIDEEGKKVEAGAKPAAKKTAKKAAAEDLGNFS